MSRRLDLSARRDLCAAHCTLDGEEAAICGATRLFAVVRTLDGKLSGEWAWETASDIVARGGDFRL